MRLTAIVLSVIACVVALPLVALMFFIFGSTLTSEVSGFELVSVAFLALAGFHLLFTGTAVAFATRQQPGFQIAAIVMATLSLFVTAGAFVIGPALLFGMSGA